MVAQPVSIYNGIVIDYSRDKLLPEKGLAMLTAKGFYKKDNEDSPQQSFARAATCYCFGDYELAQRIYDAASKHWFTFASPVLSNAVDVEWPTFTEDEWLDAASWLQRNVEPDGMPISCFAKGTPIFTIHGMKNIEDIAVGDKVLTHKGRFRRVLATRKKSSNDIYELQCSTNATKLYVTGNHLMYTNSGWKRVDSLNKGVDLIAQSSLVNKEVEDSTLYLNLQDLSKDKINSGNFSTKEITSKVEIDKDMAWAIGFWFAEGSTSDNGAVRVTHGDIEPCEKWQKIVSEKFGLNGTISHPVGRNWYNGEVYSVQLSRNFDKIFGKGCKTKCLPDEWMECKWSQEVFESFIEGFYLGDGFKTIEYRRFEITNVKLASQIALLLMEHGYIVSGQYRKYIHHNKAKMNNVYNAVISYKSKDESNKVGVRTGVPMVDGLKYVTIDTLQKIPSGEIDVYDIQVEEDESFSVAGLIAHNCFLVKIPDNKKGIVEARTETAWLSMMGGGVGVYAANRSPDEKSTGVMSHLRGYDADTLSYRQTASRRGSIAAYVDVTHPEIQSFIQMRNPVGGDANKKCFNLNNAVNLPDSFMEAVINEQDYELVDPKHGPTGRKLNAAKVFEEVLEMRFETGEPYLHFVDTSNRCKPKQITNPLYKVEQSNLC